MVARPRRSALYMPGSNPKAMAKARELPADTIMKNANVLRRLISTCVDDERTLQHESKIVDEGRAGTLRRLARGRGKFVDELEQLVGHTQRRASGSWAELLREAGRRVQVVAAGRAIPWR